MSSQKVPLLILGTCTLIAFGFLFFLNNKPYFFNSNLKEEECVQFAKKIETSIEQNDASLLNSVLNHHAFLKKVAKNIGTYNKTQLVELAFQAKENIRFGDMVMSYLKSNDGYFNFTKFYKNKNTPHIIFRIYSQMEGLNYFDCELKRINGKINITDVFIYYAGELWSTSYSRHMKMLAENNFGSIENIHPKNEFHNSLLKVDYINDLLFIGEIEQATLVFESIPAAFQNDKIIHGASLKIAHQKNDSAYVKAIQRYLSIEPDNEVLHLFFNVLQNLAAKKNPEIRQSITALNKKTGPDSLMQLFVGQSFQNESDFRKAIECFDSVINRYPDLFETYWYKLVALIELENYSEAILFLDTIMISFEAKKIDLDDLLIDYPEFINSDIYLDWRNLTNI